MREGRQPDVVLVMTDQQRFDWVGHASDGFFETPVLDALAGRGVTFTHGTSASTTCVPSRTSLLTGLHHGRVPTVEGKLAMAEGVWTLARGLRDAGYETAAVGRMHFLPMHADHGFDTMRICENINPGSGYTRDDTDDYRRWMVREGRPDWRVWDPDGRGGIVPHSAGTPRTFPDDAAHHSTGWIEAEAVRFLRERRSDRPLFLVVSFPHPHAPYDPPEPYASMYDPADVEEPSDGFEVNDPIIERFRTSWEAFYDWAKPSIRTTDAEGRDKYQRVITAIRGMVRHIDDALGSLVAELDLDSTLLWFTSDHGDYGGHRGLYRKDPWVPFEDLLRVPLVVAGGAVGAPGTTVDATVQTGSLAATVLDVAGVAPPDDDGDFPSLRGFLDGAPDPDWAERPMLAALTSGYPTVRFGDRKVIGTWSGDEVLVFDLAEDPGETRSFADDPAYRSTLEAAGAAFRSQLEKPPARRHDPPPTPTPR